MQIEFFFDFSCPYAYLGSTQIEKIAERNGAELIWKPMLLGGVFRAVDTPMNLAAAQAPAKTRNSGADMQRWAEMWEVPLTMPSAHPQRSVRALRTLLATEEEHWPTLIHALYRAYWVLGKDFDSQETMRWALAEAGIAGQEAERALAANEDSKIKSELRERTQEAIDRSVFGAPSMFISGEGIDEPIFFWGQDRIAMTEAVLQGWRPGSNSAPQPTHIASARKDAPTLDFWYDFSSPFAYLGATQIEGLARRAGLQLRWRPLLLGALFKSLGTANVPLLAMSEAKRQYFARELGYWSSFWQEPFQFSTHFPLRSVTALRLALLAGPRVGELSRLLFRAAWVENKNIADDSVLLELLDGAGFAGKEMLGRCQDAEVKALLRSNTEEAMELGVFGVPCCALSLGGETQLYWGQDRLELLEWKVRASEPETREGRPAGQP